MPSEHDDPVDPDLIVTNVCALCGAIQRTYPCGDHMHIDAQAHNAELHRLVIKRAQASVWN